VYAKHQDCAQTGNWLALHERDLTAVTSTAQTRSVGREMSGVGLGDDGDEDDGLGDLSGLVKLGLEVTPTVVAASRVAVSIPVDRGLSATQALRQFNEVTAGWANRAKTPTIFTLLRFVVGSGITMVRAAALRKWRAAEAAVVVRTVVSAAAWGQRRAAVVVRTRWT
jgi:hypothetical protein